MSKLLFDDPTGQAQKRVVKALARHPAACGRCVRAGACEIQDFCVQNRPDLPDFPYIPKLRKLSEHISVEEGKCVGCGRCVAFLKQMGQPENGEMPPVGKYDFPLSGNLTDLCPAGALTDATRSEIVREWDIVRHDGIDITDGVGAEIEIGTRGSEIVRIRAKNDGEVISNKARFGFARYARNRLDSPYVRVNGKLKKCDWKTALTAVAEKMAATAPEKMAGLIGNEADCESMQALRDLFALFHASAIDARPNGVAAYFDTSSRLFRLFNTPFSFIAEADALLCVGARFDVEAPAIGRLIRRNDMPKAFVGAEPDLPYDIIEKSAKALQNAFDDTGKIAKMLKRAKKPMVVVGLPVLNRPDAPAAMRLIFDLCRKYGVLRTDWNGYNLLNGRTGFIGAAELGLIPSEPLLPKIKSGAFDFIYLLNRDDFDRSENADAFVVYQGIFASEAARKADVVLPALSCFEKRATYVNMAGNAAETTRVTPPFGQSREDWKILRALSELTPFAPLPYNDLAEVRDRMAGENVIFYHRDEIAPAEIKPFGTAGTISDAPVTAEGRAE